MSDLAGKACDDCIPAVELSRQRGIAGPVLVAVVTHQATCPWAARVTPDGAVVMAPAGSMPELDSVTNCTGAMLLHTTAEAVG